MLDKPENVKNINSKSSALTVDGMSMLCELALVELIVSVIS
jgi:hypothetical protein